MAEIPLTDPQCERLPLDWGRDLCTLNLVKPFVDSSDGNWRGNHGCTDTALRTKYAVISMFHPMIRGWQRIVKSPQTDVPGSYRGARGARWHRSSLRRTWGEVT